MLNEFDGWISVMEKDNMYGHHFQIVLISLIMKRLKLIFISVITFVPLAAQETYENANIATEDLNGTARYVGMGGAMDALGADISNIGSNPAGIGLFRHSVANVSFGFVSQQGGDSFSGGKKTNMSFDQAGFVYARRTGRSSFLNFAFNYHKSRNFDFILSAADALNGASQNKLSYLKGAEGVFGINDKGWPNVDYNSPAFTQIDYLYYETLLPLQDDKTGNGYKYNDANGYLFNRANSGYIGEYDFNISGNINDRVYLGLTFGISDVNYKGYSEYTETLAGGVGNITITDERRISGTGFNVKAGVIFRPIEASPLRVGFSVATPTWYDLNTSNYTVLLNGTNINNGMSSDINESYDFKLFTPWKFGFSIGTTFRNKLAVGAGYEYADYGSLDSRVNTGGGYYYDEYYESSSSDPAMNRHTEKTLKGVSTFKVGAELKPLSNLAIRAGYNYVSPMYEKKGYKDGTIYSYGTFYSSSTDYTNWEATNRITCGIGYNVGKLSFDLAYQYSAQSGDFKPFQDDDVTIKYPNETEEYINNICNAVKVDNKRHQLLFTLGYHF